MACWHSATSNAAAGNGDAPHHDGESHQEVTALNFLTN
jgi:hypothetical protein